MDSPSVEHRLSTARGQIDAVIRMVEDGRGCGDILHQLSAVRGMIQNLHRELLERHIRECILPLAATQDPAVVVKGLLDAAFGHIADPV